MITKSDREKAWIGRTVRVAKAPLGYESNVGRTFKVADAQEQRCPEGPVLLKSEDGCWCPATDVAEFGTVVVSGNYFRSGINIEVTRGLVADPHAPDARRTYLQAYDSAEAMAAELERVAAWLRDRSTCDFTFEAD